MIIRLAILFVATGILLQSGMTYAADTSANLGFSSHYIFRGVPQ